MSESNVVGLNNVPDAIAPGQVCAATVALLRNLLAEAERGEVIGVAIAAVSPNSMVRATWCGMANTSTMMAAITAMEALYKRAWLDGMAG